MDCNAYSGFGFSLWRLVVREESGYFASELANLHFCSSRLYIFNITLSLPKLLNIYVELSMTRSSFIAFKPPLRKRVYKK